MSRGVAAAALVALGLVGCDSHPRAPLLHDQAVFHDAQQGLRFVAPEGWRMRARGALPTGKLEVERLLVEYQRLAAVPATLRVSAADVDPTDSLAGYLSANLLQKRAYRPVQTLPDTTVGGLEGKAFLFTPAGGAAAKEVIAVRHGGHVFFFTGEFLKEDAAGRDAFRQAVQSVVWGK